MTKPDQVKPARLLRLPLRMADFSRRGFRLDRPEARATLETHATAFLTGFNLAARHWRDPHPALAAIDEAERGFGYEGAAMYAAIRSLLIPGDGAAFGRLHSGHGDGFTHLIHVGYGWAGAVLRIPFRDTIPATPLLRWLALDGTGFAQIYFGGLRALRKHWVHRPTACWEARAAGFGRALWFVESADVDSIAAIIEEAPAHAREHLWSGIGLASCYAGCADAGALDSLVAASGEHWPHFAQGALFASAARARSRVVPVHTTRACRHLLGITPEAAHEWTDIAARGLTDSRDVTAYLEWKSRLRQMVVTSP